MAPSSASQAEFFASEEFRRRMARVGAASVPFGNSTPSSVVYERVAQAYREAEEEPSGGAR